MSKVVDIRPEQANANVMTSIDVRDNNELSGPLPKLSRSRHVALRHLIEEGLPDDIDPAAPLLVVCRSGARSRRAAEHLIKRGYTKVHNLEGGLIAWYERAADASERGPR